METKNFINKLSLILLALVLVGCGAQSQLVMNNGSGGSSDVATVAAPIVAGVAPEVLSTSGGTVVTITGSNFTEDVGVTIGGVVCTIQTLTASCITCTAGAVPEGSADIVLTINLSAPVVVKNIIDVVAPSAEVARLVVVGGTNTGGGNRAVVYSGHIMDQSLDSFFWDNMELY